MYNFVLWEWWTLRNLLDILPPSVCGIFRSGPSSTLQYCSREEEGEGEESWTSTLPMPSSLKSIFYLLAAGRRQTSRMMALASFYSSSLLLPPFLLTIVLKSARRTTPEDAARRWWQKSRKFLKNRDHVHEARRIKLYTTPAMKVYMNLSMFLTYSTFFI